MMFCGEEAVRALTSYMYGAAHDADACHAPSQAHSAVHHPISESVSKCLVFRAVIVCRYMIQCSEFYKSIFQDSPNRCGGRCDRQSFWVSDGE